MNVFVHLLIALRQMKVGLKLRVHISAKPHTYTIKKDDSQDGNEYEICVFDVTQIHQDISVKQQRKVEVNRCIEL